MRAARPRGARRAPRSGSPNGVLLLALLALLAGGAPSSASFGGNVSGLSAGAFQRRSLTQLVSSVEVSNVPAVVSPTQPLIVHVTGRNPPVSQLSWTATVAGVPTVLTASTVRATKEKHKQVVISAKQHLLHLPSRSAELRPRALPQVATWTSYSGTTFRAGIAVMPGFFTPGVNYTFYLNYIVPGTSAGDQLASFSVQASDGPHVPPVPRRRPYYSLAAAETGSGA